MKTDTVWTGPTKGIEVFQINNMLLSHFGGSVSINHFNEESADLTLKIENDPILFVRWYSQSIVVQLLDATIISRDAVERMLGDLRNEQ